MVPSPAVLWIVSVCEENPDRKKKILQQQQQQQQQQKSYGSNAYQHHVSKQNKTKLN